MSELIKYKMLLSDLERQKAQVEAAIAGIRADIRALLILTNGEFVEENIPEWESEDYGMCS